MVTASIGPRDIGFFDPAEITGNRDVQTRDDKTVYRNVFNFTRRLRVNCRAYITAAIQRLIPRCLLGTANKWYIDELSDETRDRLGNGDDSLDEWCRRLENRFREPPSKSHQRMRDARYTKQDARDRRDPATYVQEMMTWSRNSRVGRTDNEVILWAYEQIDPDLRGDLPGPDEDTTLDELLAVLNRKKTFWYDKYHNHGSTGREHSKPVPSQSQPLRRQGPYPPWYGYNRNLTLPLYPLGYTSPSVYSSGYTPPFPPRTSYQQYGGNNQAQRTPPGNAPVNQTANRPAGNEKPSTGTNYQSRPPFRS